MKWSGNLLRKGLCVRIRSLSGTLIRHRALRTSIAHSHVPQLFTAFPLELPSAGRQKSDFHESHSPREYKEGI